MSDEQAIAELPSGSPEEAVYEPAALDGEASDQISSLYLESAPLLAASLRKQFGNGPPDPEDISHQAFQKLIEHRDPANIRDVNAFVWGIARNLMLKARRSLSTAARYEHDVRERYFSERGYSSDPQRVINAKKQIELVNNALKSMPPRRSRAYYLRRVEGLTVVEIAKRLKISHAAVSKHVAKAVAEIDRLLDEEDS